MQLDAVKTGTDGKLGGIGEVVDDLLYALLGQSLRSHPQFGA